MWPLPQLLVPAHQPALLDAGTLGSLPNPLQGKELTHFPLCLSGRDKQRVISGWRWQGLLSESLQKQSCRNRALLRRSHDDNQCLKYST